LFQVGKLSGEDHSSIVLPVNFADVAKDHYLLTALPYAIQLLEYKVKFSFDKKIDPKADMLDHGENGGAYLQGLTSHLVKGKIKKWKSEKGAFAKGKSQGFRYFLKIVKGINPKFFKLKKDDNPMELAFGKAWDRHKGYTKKVLDLCILALKKCKIDSDTVKSWSKSIEDLTKEFGISSEWMKPTKMITEFEIKLILGDKKEDKPKLNPIFSSDITDPFGGIRSLDQQVHQIHKVWGPAKKIVNDIVDDRMRFIYSHAENKKAVSKKNKPKLEVLISNVKKDPKFFRVFSPQRAAGVHHTLTAFQLPGLPDNDKQLADSEAMIQQWTKTHKNPEAQAVSGAILNWWRLTINE